MRLLPLALLLGLLPLAPVSAQDVAAGAALFKARCAVCHGSGAGDRPGIGPNLAGVVGRKAGSTPFGYSDALKNSRIVWTTKTLDAFLTAPGALLPGTRMVVEIDDARERADVVAYLASLRK